MKAPLRALFVEDSETDAKLIVAALSPTFALDFERVEDEKGMRAALAGRAWEVILCDWSLPRFHALGALHVLKEAGQDVPFILVSGTVGDERAVEAMRAGAHDYVLKTKLSRLVPVIERELRESKARQTQRQATEDLRRSEARFARLSESGVVGIIIGDVHGNILDANTAYMKMLGLTREEIAQGNIRWTDLTPPEQRPLNERALAQLKDHGLAAPFETESLHRDGSRVPLLIGVASLDYPECIAFAVDLTERKRAESALRESENQLRHAQKMEAVGRLAGGVAHDFNNVLSVILSYSEMLAAELEESDPMRQDLEEIRQAGLRAAGLTRQLLTFSRQQVLEPTVVDLNELLVGIEKMLRRILGEDIELVLVPTAARGKVKVDPGSIEQVVMNLAVNARDAMPTGGKLTIETGDVVLDEGFARGHVGANLGPHVMLAVTDTGHGMDPATRARIFEPFFTTKETGKGTGLGLSTVFGIVQQSGGSIWVYSELGEGTTFKVYLPCVDGAVEAKLTQHPAPPRHGTETVLLVEDEDHVRGVVLGILRKHGYRVLEARHAGEALLIAEKYDAPIDLLISDVVMPQMSGPELARRLGALRPSMRVLCMSGYTDDSIVRHGILGSEIPFLQKPIMPQALTRKVREVLDLPEPPPRSRRDGPQ